MASERAATKNDWIRRAISALPDSCHGDPMTIETMVGNAIHFLELALEAPAEAPAPVNPGPTREELDEALGIQSEPGIVDLAMKCTKEAMARIEAGQGVEMLLPAKRLGKPDPGNTRYEREGEDGLE